MILLDLLDDSLRIFRRADNDRHRVDPDIVQDEDAVRLQVMRVPLRLQALERDEDVRLAGLDDRLLHLVAVADEGDDRAAALRHTVDLGELDVIAGLGRDVA